MPMAMPRLCEAGAFFLNQSSNRRAMPRVRPAATAATLLLALVVGACARALSTDARPRSAPSLLAAARGLSQHLARAFSRAPGGPFHQHEVRRIPAPRGQAALVCTTALDCSIAAAEQYQATGRAHAVKAKMCARTVLQQQRLLSRARRAASTFKSALRPCLARLSAERRRAEAAEARARASIDVAATEIERANSAEARATRMLQQSHAKHAEELASRDVERGKAAKLRSAEKRSLFATIEQLKTQVDELKVSVKATEKQLDEAQQALQEERAKAAENQQVLQREKSSLSSMTAQLKTQVDQLKLCVNATERQLEAAQKALQEERARAADDEERHAIEMLAALRDEKEVHETVLAQVQHSAQADVHAERQARARAHTHTHTHTHRYSTAPRQMLRRRRQLRMQRAGWCRARPARTPRWLQHCKGSWTSSPLE